MQSINDPVDHQPQLRLMISIGPIGQPRARQCRKHDSSFLTCEQNDSARAEYSIDRRLSVLLVPDKDADGLSAGSLMHRTLTHLGHPPDLISVHHLSKGTNVHSDAEMAKIASIGSERVIVLDQGSRPGKPLVPIRDETRVLIIDHHMSNEVSCKAVPIAQEQVAGGLSGPYGLSYATDRYGSPSYLHASTRYASGGTSRRKLESGGRSCWR